MARTQSRAAVPAGWEVAHRPRGGDCLLSISATSGQGSGVRLRGRNGDCASARRRHANQFQRDVECFGRAVPPINSAATIEVRRNFNVIDSNELHRHSLKLAPVVWCYRLSEEPHCEAVIHLARPPWDRCGRLELRAGIRRGQRRRSGSRQRRRSQEDRSA